MLSIDYTYSSLNLNDVKKQEHKIKKIVSKFKNKDCEGKDFTGWYDYPCSILEEDFVRLEKCAEKIKKAVI